MVLDSMLNGTFDLILLDLNLPRINGLSKVEAEKTEISHKRVTLRFSKNVPSVIGVDMKTYGPFAVEDIASLPIENAKILVKQGLAVLVEVPRICRYLGSRLPSFGFFVGFGFFNFCQRLWLPIIING